MTRIAIILTIMVLSILSSCSNQKKLVKAGKIEENAPFIIYKTKADYANNVPVFMNNEKTMIVAYPAPTDLLINNEYTMPVKLANGYLLDRRGISRNVVFTGYTYEEFSKMEQAPSIQEMQSNILDLNPIVEMYDCRKHSRDKDDIKALNKLIREGFPGCKRVF